MSFPLRALLPWVLCSIFALPARAASISYLLDQSNALDDGVNYLQVTVADGLDGAIDFTVEALDPLTSIAGDNFGIQSFAFNVVDGLATAAADVDGLPDGWTARHGRRMGGFGLFDIALKGRGWARTGTLTFSITGIDGDTPGDYAVLSTGRSPQGRPFFAAHVAGWQTSDPGQACLTSAYFGGSAIVPLPPAAWLFGSALAALAAGRRRAINL